MTPTSSKKTVLTIFFISYVLILVYNFFNQLSVGYAKESWNISEILINYQGGFVRRGLLGELFYSLHSLLGINPYTAIITFCAIAYFTLIAFFTILFIKKKQSLFLLPFIFVLGNPIINNFWVRKDVFLILIFILILFAYVRLNKPFLRFILVNLLLILGILIHEGFAFISLPVLVLLFVSERRSANIHLVDFAKSLVFFAPSIFIFLATFIAKGSFESAQAIWHSWQPITFPIQAEQTNLAPSAIDALSWSIKKGISFSYNIFTNFNSEFYTPILWSLVFILIYYTITQASKLNLALFRQKDLVPINRNKMSHIMILQFIAVLPLILLGWDWGRWVFYWVISSLTVYFLVPNKMQEASLEPFFGNIGFKLNGFLDKVFGQSNLLFIAILIGFPQYSWELIESIQHSAIGTVLKTISIAIEQLFSVFLAQ